MCNQDPPEAIQLEVQASLLSPRWSAAFAAWLEQQQQEASFGPEAGSPGGVGGYRNLQGDNTVTEPPTLEDVAAM